MDVKLLLLGALVVCLLPLSSSRAEGDAKRGQQLYNERCFNCHDMDSDRTGPSSRHVYGRQAGTGPDFDYSDAMKKSKVVWSDTTLDQWLKNPDQVIPGQKMFFMTTEPQDRADIIAYLKQASTEK